ncbi:MAG: glycosyltransferase family 9 protein [Flavisolibacter sp.]|nr:glycosyltransferase family 9 protein [Flavisolibacter sp.]
MSDWMSCKKILCIRPDNMGDLIMSAPAIRALKETFGCTITLLTSSMAAGIVPFLSEIDEVMIFDAPWVKNANEAGVSNFYQIIEQIRQKQFDAAVVFTVFSQNPLPSAMIAYLAGIPRRLAYCRENSYQLLTHWVPDKEPYGLLQHQVQRDLELVKTVGARAQEKGLRLKLPKNVWPSVNQKLKEMGVDMQKPWLIFHAGVSERKREYPQPLWIETGKLVAKQINHQIILTGNAAERTSIEIIKKGIGGIVFNAAGLFDLEEFITLIKRSPIVVSVNTSAAHIAAAVGTPIIVLYALSNPQHSPWMSRGKVLLYDIPGELRSRNEILQYVHQHIHPKNISMIRPDEIVASIRDVLVGDCDCFIPAMIPLQTGEEIF